jgi:hypothetical protein
MLITSFMSEFPFAMKVDAEIWSDVQYVLARVPRSVRWAEVEDCLDLARHLKRHKAVDALRAMRAVSKRYYLPIFFLVLRTAACRPLVPSPPPPKSAHPYTADEWKGLFRLPWEREALAESGKGERRDATKQPSFGLAVTPAGEHRTPGAKASAPPPRKSPGGNLRDRGSRLRRRKRPVAA